MEDGSGGFMGDIVFNGGQSEALRPIPSNSDIETGKYGIWVGNQQYASLFGQIFEF